MARRCLKRLAISSNWFVKAFFNFQLEGLEMAWNYFCLALFGSVWHQTYRPIQEAACWIAKTVDKTVKVWKFIQSYLATNLAEQNTTVDIDMNWGFNRRISSENFFSTSDE